ncbi:uncharacterized protein A4U43_C07F26610 [Asparagus officinalis]|uniref:DUF4408 domain-containing protein n=1 Tax=Asparagus officinalis TaxID=4686 RepID=A0A5P1EI02_ASPOF|nr:uncharacterized protein LOC109849053 [Asparagus officinalis]ONK64489.1 uncharacterized protein A4U43_C07F26610 [Asparagus officinalis]
MEGQKRSKRREEEIVEAALVLIGAALLVSVLSKILSLIEIKWSVSFAAIPSPLLFLLLHVIIASIVITSTIQPNNERYYCHSHRRGTAQRKKTEKGKKKKKSSTASLKIETKDHLHDREVDEGGDAEELNARAEAFIVAFRQQLRVDSFGSRRSFEGYYCS